MRTRLIAFALMLATGGFVSACAGLHGGGTGPHIDAVRPDNVSVPPGAVVEVVIYGRGFVPGTPGGNTVQFGDLRLTSVPASTDGTRIRFVVPDRMPLRGDAAPMPIEAGSYSVRVENAAGRSNTASLRIVQ